MNILNRFLAQDRGPSKSSGSLSGSPKSETRIVDVPRRRRVPRHQKNVLLGDYRPGDRNIIERRRLDKAYVDALIEAAEREKNPQIEAPEYLKPPKSRAERELERKRFNDSLTEYNRVKANVETEQKEDPSRRVFLCTSQKDITQFHDCEDEEGDVMRKAMKKRYKFDAFLKCPYCVPQARTPVWCPFHLGKAFKGKEKDTGETIESENTQRKTMRNNFFDEWSSDEGNESEDEVEDGERENAPEQEQQDEEEPEFFMSLREYREKLLSYKSLE